MFELEFRGRNSKAGLPIVVVQTDKLCSTDAYDSGYVRTSQEKNGDLLNKNNCSWDTRNEYSFGRFFIYLLIGSPCFDFLLL